MTLPTLLIAEDDFMIRVGHLELLLVPHYTIVSSVGDGLEAVADAEKYRPEIVLLDVSLPGLRGFDAARRILASNPECKVIFVSNYADSSYLQAARELGAGGYVLKSRVESELLPAILCVLGGTFYQSTF